MPRQIDKLHLEDVEDLLRSLQVFPSGHSIIGGSGQDEPGEMGLEDIAELQSILGE